MRKYFQITFVLGMFGLLVLARQLKGNDQPVIVGSQNNSNPTPAPSSSAAGVTAQPDNLPVSASSPTPVPSTGMMQPTAMPMMGKYKNGTYTGSVQDAFYGNIQVRAVISGGKITDVIFLQYPNDNGTSRYVNAQADPMLKQEAIQVQSAQVDIISGASASSQAFQASLADALSQAK